MIWIICLSILIFFTTAFWVVFTVVFILRRKLKNKDYIIKNKFNYLNNNPIGSNLKFIEMLVENNNTLQPILEHLNHQRNNYIEQVKGLKTLIQDNTRLLKSYRLVSIYKSTKQIEDNITCLESLEQEFKQFALDTNEYSSYVSEISIKLCDLKNKINSFFFKTHLDLSYRKLKKYHEFEKKINEVTKKINKQLYYINNFETHKFFLSQIANLKNLWENLILPLFDIEKHLDALDYVIKNIEELINANSCSGDKIKNTKKIILEIKDMFSVKFYGNISKSLDFENSKKRIIKEIKRLEDLGQSLRLNNNFSKIFDKYFQNFSEGTKHYFSIVDRDDFMRAYKSILDNFKKEKEISAIAESCLKENQKIIKAIQEFSNMLKNTNVNYINVLEKMIMIVKQIINFQEMNEKMYNLALEKYGKFLSISLKLSNIDTQLFHLERLVKKFRNVNTETDEIQKISRDREEVSILLENLSKNVLSYDSINSKLKEIENFIELTTESINTDSKLLKIDQKLKLYANRYYSKENKQILNEIDNLVKNKKYKEAANAYIQFINKNKKMKKAS